MAKRPKPWESSYMPGRVSKPAETMTVEIQAAEIFPKLLDRALFQAMQRAAWPELVVRGVDYGSVTGRMVGRPSPFYDVLEVRPKGSRAPQKEFPKFIELTGVYCGPIEEYRGRLVTVHTKLGGPLGITDKCVGEAFFDTWVELPLKDFEFVEG